MQEYNQDKFNATVIDRWKNETCRTCEQEDATMNEATKLQIAKEVASILGSQYSFNLTVSNEIISGGMKDAKFETEEDYDNLVEIRSMVYRVLAGDIPN